MAEIGEDGVLQDRWQPVFRHAAGTLGSQYLTAIRTERRLRAWRTAQPKLISLPPKNFGDEGEWVDLGTGATLLSYAPTEWVAGATNTIPESFQLARVAVDGADAPIFALLKRPSDAAAPSRGDRLALCFADEGAREGGPVGPDFWFEPAAGGARS